jgi:hypothetical protein
MWRHRFDGEESCILEGPSTDDLKVTLASPINRPPGSMWYAQAYIRTWNALAQEQIQQFTTVDDNSTETFLDINLTMTVADWVNMGVNPSYRAEWVVQLIRVDGDGQTITIVHGPVVFTLPTPPFSV